jgi:hypothetical protein
MNQTFVNSTAKDFLKLSYCAFDVVSSRIGLVVYSGRNIIQAVQLASRSAVDWASAIDNAYAVPGLFTIGGTTPTVEALELARKMMKADGVASHEQHIIVLTDGQPTPLSGVAQDEPQNGALPYASYLYDSKAGPNNCNGNILPRVPNCF